MGHFKELMMENEEYFHEYIKDEGITVNGKVYHSGDLLLSEMPEAYFDLFSQFIYDMVPELEYDR